MNIWHPQQLLWYPSPNLQLFALLASPSFLFICEKSDSCFGRLTDFKLIKLCAGIVPIAERLPHLRAYCSEIEQNIGAKICHFSLQQFFLIDNDNGILKKNKKSICLLMDCFRDMQTRQARKDNHYNTQHIDSLFTRAGRLGDVFVMWLSGKLYELLLFDKHMRRQHPLCKCPVGRGIMLHISKLSRSRHICREYEWDWGFSRNDDVTHGIDDCECFCQILVGLYFMAGFLAGWSTSFKQNVLIYCE